MIPCKIVYENNSYALTGNIANITDKQYVTLAMDTEYFERYSRCDQTDHKIQKEFSFLFDLHSGKL